MSKHCSNLYLFVEMVDIGDGDNNQYGGDGNYQPGGYDLYGQRINSSVYQDDYNQGYYQEPNNMYGQVNSITEQEQDTAYGNFGAGKNTGPRRRNVQGGGSAGPEADEDLNRIHIEMGNNSSGDENQMLLNKKKVHTDKMPRCYAFRRCLGCIVSRERRHLTL